jgi:hypothetical protein
MPVIFVPIAHGSSSSSHGLSIPSSVVYFLKQGEEPKDYIDRAIKDAFPGFMTIKYEDGHFIIGKENGFLRDSSDDLNVYVRSKKFSNTSIISVLTMDEDGVSRLTSLAFLYSLDKILGSSNALLQE